jgi:hypothetical protein
MPMLRAPGPTVCVALFMAVALTGCLGTRLSTDEPAGVRLQGVWKLNRTASDDPQKIIAALREEALKKQRRAMNAAAAAADAPPMNGPGGGRRASQQSPQESADQLAQYDLMAQGPGMDPLRNSPTMHEFREILQRSEYVTIRQSPDQVSFDYGTTVRSYTPGAHSVVSSENGVADQATGWKSKEYVISIKPQIGPHVTEEYGLSPDGKQLIVKSQIGPFELQKVNFTRVYDVTGAAVPNSRPSND